MSLMTRLAERFGLERRTANGGGTLSMAVLAGGTLTTAGIEVTTTLAQNLSAVTAAINAISGTVASMPVAVYRRRQAGREELPDHPVARWYRRGPNARLTWPAFAELLLGDALLFGNSIAVIERDGAGRATALHPVPWAHVSPMILADGRRAFDVSRSANLPLPSFDGSRATIRFLEDEVLHLADRSDDGILGRSRISRAPEVLGVALGLQTFAGSIWANSATPSGVLQTDQKLAPETHARLREQFQGKYAGARNGGRFLLLESGLKWSSMSITPEDAEVLASRRFSIEEICRLYGVPPPILQDLSHGTFTNSREAGRWFAQFTLAPWVRKLEAAFDKAVFTDPELSIEVDMSALMRGDAETRWQSHKIAVEAGILDPNEVREIEGFNPRPAAPPAQPAPPPAIG